MKYERTMFHDECSAVALQKGRWGGFWRTHSVRQFVVWGGGYWGRNGGNGGRMASECEAVRASDDPGCWTHGTHGYR